MTDNFDRILDGCLDRLNRGESLEACLADYPEHAGRLRPLLQAVCQTKDVYSFVPETATRRAAKQRFTAALEEERRKQPAKRPFITGLLARPLVWATVVTVILIAVLSYANFRSAFQPAGVPPDPEGNFVFLMSDDVNAIGDFESLNVTISRASLLLGGSTERWVEFEPELKDVDLTQLQGEKTQQIWRGNIPEGDYTKVVIYISRVRGVLKATKQSIEIKLPSGKLQITKPFRVTTDDVTSFTYDLTVVSAGNARNGQKYILKPQADQSGAEHKPAGKGKGNKK